MKNRNLVFLLFVLISNLMIVNQLSSKPFEPLTKNFNVLVANVKKFANCVKGKKECSRAEIMKARSGVIGAGVLLLGALGFGNRWWQQRQKIEITPQAPIITQPEIILAKEPEQKVQKSQPTMVPESKKAPTKEIQPVSKESPKVVDYLTMSKSDFPFGEAPDEADLNDRLDNLAQFKLSLVHPAFEGTTNFIKDRTTANFHQHREQVASALNAIEWLKSQDIEPIWIEYKEVSLKNNKGQPIQTYSLSSFIQELAQQFGLMQNNHNRWILKTSAKQDI